MLSGHLAVVLALAAGPDALAPAREALAQGDLARAEELALAEATPPHEGAALDLVGAARFRAGRPAEALEAFERADAAADPPPRGRALFNRAACLEALRRLPEAEARYLEAAEADPSLAALALASAGFVALDGGAPERARALAERARAAGGPGAERADELLARLADEATADRRAEAEAAHRAGLAAYDAGRWAEAKAQFLRAMELDPSAGASHVMAGAVAAKLGEVDEARRLLAGALAMPLDAAEARAAREHLAALGSLSGTDRPLGWSGALHAGGGHDSDVLESGGARVGELVGAGRIQSGYGAAGLLVRHRGALGPRRGPTLEFGYRLEELAYLAPAAEDYSVQEHTLWAALEAPVGERLLAGLQLTAQRAFTGRSHFRGLQTSGAARGWAVLFEGSGWATRLDLGYTEKRGNGTEFAYLTGHRLDGALTQGLDVGRLSFRGTYGIRQEEIGALQLSGVWPVPGEVCPSDECTQRYDVPLSYLEQRLVLSARAAMGRWLDLSLSAGWAWRAYEQESALVVRGEDVDARRLDPVRRRDQRLVLGAAAIVHPARSLDLTFSGEYTAVDSNVQRGGSPLACQPPDYVCHALDYGDATARRTVVGVDLGWRW